MSTVTRRKAILAVLLVTAALIEPAPSCSAVLNITIVRDARTIQAELMEPSAEPERNPRVETLWEDCRHFFALIRPGGDYAEERNTQNFLNQLPEVMELFNDLGHFDRSLDLAAMGAELTEEIPPAIRLREAHAHAGVGNLALIRGAEEDAAVQYRVAIDQLRGLGTRHFHVAEGIEALLQMINARKTMDRLPVVYHYRMLNVYYAGLDTLYINGDGATVCGQTGRNVGHQILAEMGFEVLRIFIDTYTSGQIQIEWENIDFPGVVRDFMANKLENPQIEDIDPPPFQLYFDRAQTVDQYNHLYNTEGIPVRTATGGGFSPPYIPWVAYGTYRSYINIPTDWLGQDSYRLFLHETMHNFENMIGGLPPHPWLPEFAHREQPWHGDSEIEYYIWILTQALAGKYPRIQNRVFRPERMSDPQLQRIRDAAAGYSTERLRRGYLAYQDYRQNRNGAAHDHDQISAIYHDNPFVVVAAVDYAQSLLSRQDGVEALVVLDCVIDLFGSTVPAAAALVNRAHIHSGAQNSSRAAADYRAAIVLNPAMGGWLYQNLWSFSVNAGEYAQALETYTSVLDAGYVTLALLFYHGQALWHQGQHEQALRSIEAAARQEDDPGVAARASSFLEDHQRSE